MIAKTVFPDFVRYYGLEDRDFDIDKPVNYFTKVEWSQLYCKKYPMKDRKKLLYAMKAQSLETTKYYLQFVTKETMSLVEDCYTSIEIMQYFLDEGYQFTYNAFDFAYDLEHLNFLKNLNCSYHTFASGRMAIKGLLDCLQFLHKHYRLADDVFNVAIEFEYMDIIIWLDKNKLTNKTKPITCDVNSTINLKVMKWLHNNGYQLSNLYWCAINCGDLDIVYYLMKIGCPHHYDNLINGLFKNAVQYGSLKFVKQYIDAFIDNVLLVMPYLTVMTSKEVGEYLLSLGVQPDERTMQYVCYSLDFDFALSIHRKYNIPFPIEHVGTLGRYCSFEDFQSIYTIDPAINDPYGVSIFNEIVKTKIDKMKKINWLLEKNTKFDNNTLYEAIRANDIEVVKLLYNNACPVSENCYYTAINKVEINKVDMLNFVFNFVIRVVFRGINNFSSKLTSASK